ncbi:probable serine/threonine-protein kinase PBL5 [Glycine soja]|uniref:probable serine/threonine-protein kinase PBL5 n=1 Tax=Glycine soja TaxID=3848 RepID=UPI001038B2DA|nr:probable serine/threonine-protein kinase PBL5 [Glycine soja]
MGADVSTDVEITYFYIGAYSAPMWKHAFVTSFMSGVIPSKMSQLSKLVSLDLSFLGMRVKAATLENVIVNATDIRELTLDSLNMYLEGELPEFNRSTPLRYLDLSFTGFPGKLPNNINHLESLNYLDFHASYFEGPIPLLLSNLTQLKFLGLGENNFGGEIPSSLSNLHHLIYLDLFYSNFDGENPDIIRHPNIVELIGYCAEHGQRLLIYEYCRNGSLQDALHSHDEFKTRLSWNARIRIALGAARSLEYLHEQFQPPVVHRNFKSANILLYDDVSVRVSDCGLSPLITKGSVSQLSGQLLTAYGYGAPEFESGIYTYQSDVYSFGVVMLELLTGRQSYDR